METSGYQPVSPEPSEERAGFAQPRGPRAVQSTDAPAEGASGGWNYSFVADQRTVDRAVAAALTRPS